MSSGAIYRAGNWSTWGDSRGRDFTQHFGAEQAFNPDDSFEPEASPALFSGALGELAARAEAFMPNSYDIVGGSMGRTRVADGWDTTHGIAAVGDLDQPVSLYWPKYKPHDNPVEAIGYYGYKLGNSSQYGLWKHDDNTHVMPQGAMTMSPNVQRMLTATGQRIAYGLHGRKSGQIPQDRQSMLTWEQNAMGYHYAVHDADLGQDYTVLAFPNIVDHDRNDQIRLGIDLTLVAKGLRYPSQMLHAAADLGFRDDLAAMQEASGFRPDNGPGEIALIGYGLMHLSLRRMPS